MQTATLFNSELLTIREVICDASRGGACGDEHNATPCVAIPLRGCYTVDRLNRAVVADPNTPYCLMPGRIRSRILPTTATCPS